MFRFFHKPAAEKTEIWEKKAATWNGPLEKRTCSSSLDENIEIIQSLFRDVDIVRYKTVHSSDRKPIRYFLAFYDGAVNSRIINDNLVKPLFSIEARGDGSPLDLAIDQVVEIGEIQKTDNFKEIVESITYGNTVLFAEDSDEAAICNTRFLANRAISEPDSEKVLSGPRDGFTESLSQNISQVIRRIRSHELKTKALTLGRRTGTGVSLLYIESLVDKGILNEVLRRLENIDIDGVLDSNYITELIRDKPGSPFRSTGRTERPDVVAGKLLEGRIAILVDGSPAALTVPFLFIENFQSNEDYYMNFYYSSFSRFLRITAFLLTVAVPGLYIAIVAFHHEMLPLPLLIRIAMERQSVPLPAAAEAIIMLLVFDILRETGVRMPSNIGQALSIVGALVIGQAAVEASLVAAPMIIVVAATGITSLLVPQLNAPIIYWRFFVLLMAAAFGFFGMTIGLALFLIQIINLTSLGQEQISLPGKFTLQGNKDIFIRGSWGIMNRRSGVPTQDLRRQKEGEPDE